MTGIGIPIAALLGAGAVTAGGLVGTHAERSPASAQRTAIVIDAAAGRDGRDLVDDRLGAARAELRLPRTPTEARTDVRYLAAQGYRLVVAGPRSRAAAKAVGAPAVGADGVSDAVAAVER